MTRFMSCICAASAAIAFVALSLALYGDRVLQPFDLFKLVLFGSMFAWAVGSLLQEPQ